MHGFLHRIPGPRLRLGGLLATTLLMVACAQSPQATTAPGASPTSQAPGASNRDGSRILREIAEDASLVERATGVPRTHPRFASIQNGFAMVAADPVIAPWLMGLSAEGARGPLLSRFIQQRVTAGLLRLSDEDALRFLSLSSTWMQRIPAADCQRTLEAMQKAQRPATLVMADLLDDEEIRTYYATSLAAMRADLQRRPSRSALVKVRADVVSTALETEVRRAQQQDPTRSDACASASRLMAAPATVGAANRSDAITVLLQLMTRSYANQQLRKTAPAPTPDKAAKSV